ncbi:unnamed protein product [Chrysoparadoxa australica]
MKVSPHKPSGLRLTFAFLLPALRLTIPLLSDLTLQHTAEWPFCPLCGTVLVLPHQGPVECSHCKKKATPEELGASSEVITTSAPRPLPSWAVRLTKGDNLAKKKRATVDEPCPRCNHPVMEFYTMQLRSADEGQTVFYECPNEKCRHKYSLNN